MDRIGIERLCVFAMPPVPFVCLAASKRFTQRCTVVPFSPNNSATSRHDCPAVTNSGEYPVRPLGTGRETGRSDAARRKASFR